MYGYQRKRSREIYRNPWLAVEVHDIVHPTGVEGEHVLVASPPASAIVVADGGDLLFARQPRFAVDGVVLEIVKGGIEGDETPEQCARRELREELGVVAAHWESLGVLYEIPSIVKEPVSLFLAHGIEHVDPAFEEVETIELVRIPQAVAFAGAASGQINDAITVAALLRYGIHSGFLKSEGTASS